MDISNILSMLGGANGGGGADMSKILGQLGGGGGDSSNPMASLLPMLMQQMNGNNNNSPKSFGSPQKAVSQKTPTNDEDVNYTLFKLSQDD